MRTLADLRQKLPSGCRIVAVSKLQSPEKIRALYAQGQRLFAENYAQEALSKQLELKDLDIEWHFIGRLQKNKVKHVVGAFTLLHSVDSLSLAQAIDKVAGQKNLCQKILLQINLAGELSKGGFSKDEFLAVTAQLRELKNIQVTGLMTMPPPESDPEQVRPFFRELKQIQQNLQAGNPHMAELSMGTSSDFLVAAEEGATLVRLGTVLFGSRAK